MKIDCAYDELVELHKIQPNPKNTNKHPAQQIEMLAKIIDYQGQRAPIVVSNRSGFITKGHGRLEAIKKLGWVKAAIDFQDYESEAQEYADMIADNKISELAENDPLLINDLALTMPEGFDFDLLGIPDFELADVKTLNEELEDSVPEVPAETIIKPGDLIEMGEHRLLCGDSTQADQVEKLMNGEKADMVFTDPPYGTNAIRTSQSTFDAPSKAGSRKFKPIIGDDGLETVQNFLNYIFSLKEQVLIFWGAQHYASLLPNSQAWIVWDKNREHQHHYLSDCELAWTNSNKVVRKHSQVWRGFITENEKDEKIHPTQKPIGLSEFCFTEYAPDSKLIFDPFSGSGSTLIACEKTNRKCFGMEIDPHYCDVIISRWCKYTNKTQVKINGETTEWKLN